MQQTPRPSQPSNKGTSAQSQSSQPSNKGTSAQSQSSSPRTHTQNFRFFAATGGILAALAAIVTLLQFFGIANIESFFYHPTPTSTPRPISSATPTHYPQLKTAYAGNAHGYQNASLRFTDVAQDPQGKVSLVLVFTVADNSKQQATYSCQGAFTGAQSFTLDCTQVDAPDFKIAITASVVSSGQLEGTLEATNATDPTYDHLYAWNAQANGS